MITFRRSTDTMPAIQFLPLSVPHVFLMPPFCFPKNSPTLWPATCPPLFSRLSIVFGLSGVDQVGQLLFVVEYLPCVLCTARAAVNAVGHDHSH